MENSSVPSRIRTCKEDGCDSIGREGRDKEAVFYAGQGNTCRRCIAKRGDARRIRIQNEGGEHHERIKEFMRISQAKRLYNLTADEARAMYARTACEICGRSAGSAGGKRLNIDHNHSTGKTRGVLCNRCNRGIGFFEDDPGLLEAAIAYLLTYEPSLAPREGAKP